jgi:hypothetical protein
MRDPFSALRALIDQVPAAEENKKNRFVGSLTTMTDP